MRLLLGHTAVTSRRSKTRTGPTIARTAIASPVIATTGHYQWIEPAGRVLALHAQRAPQVSLLDTLDGREAEADCLVGFRCRPPLR